MDSWVLASHNIMFGRFLPDLLEHYSTLRDRGGVDVLCIQENEGPHGHTHADAIATCLGAPYRAAYEPESHHLATVYDTTRLHMIETELLRLPRLKRLTPWERMVMRDGKVEQRYALVHVMELDTGQRITVVNVHLDMAGNTGHRARQLQFVCGWLQDRKLDLPLAACGDLNAFSPFWPRRALRRIFGPLSDLGARDTGSRPTHFYARMREPNWLKQIGVTLGRVGIDFPMRFDVVATNLPVLARGQIETDGSDHDLLWACIVRPSASRCAAQPCRIASCGVSSTQRVGN